MKNILRKILLYLPPLVVAISIVLAAFLLYFATLATNYHIKTTDGALPVPTSMAIAFSKYHLLTITAFFSLLTIGLVEWKIKVRQRKLLIEIYLVSIYLLLIAVLSMALALPLTCLCDAWQYW